MSINQYYESLNHEFTADSAQLSKAKLLETTIWTSPLDNCQICQMDFHGVMFDACLAGGWGNFCAKCFKLYNGKLGTGSGQRYELQPYGDRKAWIKTGG